MEQFAFDGESFRVGIASERWRIGMLRWGPRFATLGEAERHLTSDEAFVLLQGGATLYEIQEDGEMQETPMELGTVYNIKAGTWHHIVVRRDALVLVVENRDVSMENTQRKPLEV